MAFLKSTDKDPESILDYDLTFADWVTAPATLQSAGTSVVQDGASSPGGLTDIAVDQVVVAANIVVMWISGGTAGEKYTLKCTAVDNNSPVRTVVRRVVMKVKER
jgi:hypothetical protein